MAMYNLLFLFYLITSHIKSNNWLISLSLKSGHCITNLDKTFMYELQTLQYQLTLIILWQINDDNDGDFQGGGRGGGG